MFFHVASPIAAPDDGRMSGWLSAFFVLAALSPQLVSLAVLVAFVVVVLKVVRPRRPEAVLPLLCAVGFELLLSCATAVIASALPHWVPPIKGGMLRYRAAEAIHLFATSLGHGAASALLLLGIARLARPTDALN